MDENKEFIDRQFNSMRGHLFTLLETHLTDTEKLEFLKGMVKKITSHVWNNFTEKFSEK